MNNPPSTFRGSTTAPTAVAVSRSDRLQLALDLFKDDCRQLMEWIAVHGEGFLKKNMTIGKNLQRARQLQKSHQHFEAVAANTYTNGAKLLAAAEEFAQTGVCHPDEIMRLAKHLEQRIRSFAEKVEKRRQILNLATMFFTHDKELSSWTEALKEEVSSSGPMVAPSLEHCEAVLEQINLQREEMVDAINNTISEGETLLQVLREMMDELIRMERESSTSSSSGTATTSAGMESHDHLRHHQGSGVDHSGTGTNLSTIQRQARHNLTQSVVAVEAIVSRLTHSRSEVDELFNTRKWRMELCLQLRLFERDALKIYHELEEFKMDMQNKIRTESGGTLKREINNTSSTSSSTSAHNHHHQQHSFDVAYSEKNLRLHNDNFSRVQQVAYDFFQKGQELAQVSERNDDFYEHLLIFTIIET